MDCEKFEAALMDELYGELDELTSAALRRHAAGCARCASLLDGFRATRAVLDLPEEPVPTGLEERILAAAEDARKVVPIRSRAASVVSLAGRWAMRPQTAMAAVFLVMIGTSVLLLTGRASRAPLTASVTVTEQGAPSPEPVAAATATAAASAYATPPPPPGAALDKTASSPTATHGDSPRDEALARAGAKPTPPAKDDGMMALGGAGYGAVPTSAPGTLEQGTGAGGGADLAGAAEKKKGGPAGAFPSALATYQSGQYEDAVRAFDALAPTDPNAELWAARSVREAKGCRSALARFDRLADKHAGSPSWDALLEGALCYRAIGDFNSARTRLQALLGVDSHKDRAKAELDRMNQAQATGPAAAVRAAPAPAAPPPARPNASAVDSNSY